MYSLDLRRKVVLYVDSGGSRASASKIFGLCKETIRRWVMRKQDTGDVKPLPHGGGFPSKVDETEFKAYVESNPDKTLHEMAEHFGISHEGVAYNLRKHGYVHKKKAFYTRKEMNKDERSIEKSLKK